MFYFDFGQTDYKNMSIAHLQYSDEILEITGKEHQSPNPEDTNKYKVG